MVKATITKPRESLLVPDGGWGWLVTMGAFVICVLVLMMVPSYGIIFSSFFKENKVSATQTFWIFNANQFIGNSFVNVTGPLMKIFGWRKVIFFGGLLSSFSLVVTAFITNPNYLFITYSVFLSIGQSCAISGAFFAVPCYFDKKQGTAVGISQSGICAGQFLGPILSAFLMERFGRQGTLLIMGGLLLNKCVAAMFFHPVEWHYKKQKVLEESGVDQILMEQSSNHMEDNNENGASCIVENNFNEIENELLTKNTKIEDKKWIGFIDFGSKILIGIKSNLMLLRYHRMKILSISVAIIMASYINFFMMIPFALAEKGKSLQETSIALSIVGGGHWVSRVLTNSLVDCIPSVSTKYYTMFGSLLMCGTIMSFTMTDNIILIYVLLAFFGISIGAAAGMMTCNALEFMTLKHLPGVFGINTLLIASSFLAFGPAIGLLKDTVESYNICARVICVGPFISFSFWFFMPMAIKVDLKRDEKHAIEMEDLNDLT